MEILEKHVWDPQYKGYYEATTRDWTYSPWLRGTNRLPTDVKTMDNHLNLLEAYTCHLRVNRSKFMQNKVREHLYVMLDKIVNHDIHHFHYFMDRMWNPTSWEITYGHDIEGSWLMMETAEVLGEPEAYSKARDVCVNMARAAYEEAFTDEGIMLGDFDPVSGHRSQRLSWWEQNEAVVGFLNAWELTGEEKFLDAANQCFDYINDHFVDKKNGGWFPFLTPEGVPILSANKADGYTCPQTSARMSLEIIERYRKHLAEESK